MKEKKQYSLAFQFLLKAYEVFYKLDIEDNECETFELSFTIISQWANIIMCMDDLERLEAFVELGQYLNSMRDYYDRQKILEIFFDCLNGKEFLKLKLDFVKEQLDYIESHDDIFNREYALEGFAKMYLDLLKKNRAPKKEISAIHEKYWEYIPIRMDCVYTCINNKEYDKALDYIDECIDFEYENQDRMKFNIKLKKDIYKKQGNIKAYREELKNLILFFNDTNLEDYEILETEQLYEQLLDVLLRRDDKYLLHQYTDLLSEKYPERLLQIYRENVEKQAESTGSRKHYYQIVEELRIMKSINGGDKIVDEIIKKWKIQYKNRSAMLDELNRV